jgi:hypothetical protein
MANPQRQLSLALARPSWNRLCHPQSSVLFSPTVPYITLSIFNVPEGYLTIKTQNSMFAHRPEANILRCDETAIHRNEQTAGTS